MQTSDYKKANSESTDKTTALYSHINSNKTRHFSSTLLRNLGWPTTQGLVFCWFHTFRKMLDTCVCMTFPHFQRQIECQSYFTKMSLKTYI